MKEESKKRKKDDDDYPATKFKKIEMSQSQMPTKSSKSTSNVTYFPMSERQQYALFKQMEDDSSSLSVAKDNLESGSSVSFYQNESITPITSSAPNIASSSISNITGEKKANKRNGAGETALIQMAKKGDLNSIRTLVAEGANVNEQDYAGWTALHECSIRNYPQITLFLLRHGADVNLSGLHGDTPLHDAVRNSCPEVVRLLLKYGADPMRMNDKRIRPFDLHQTEEISKIIYETIAYSKDKKLRQQRSSDNSLSEQIHEANQSSSYLNSSKSYQTQSISSGESVSLEEQSSNSSDTNDKEEFKESSKDPYAFEDEENTDKSSFNASPHKLCSNKSGKSKANSHIQSQYMDEIGIQKETRHTSSPSDSRSHSSSPKVPPLRIKISGHSGTGERQVSEDSEPPSLEDSTNGSKSKNNFIDKPNFSDSESSLISMDIPLNKQRTEPSKLIKYCFQDSVAFDSSAQMSPELEIKEEANTKEEPTIEEFIKQENMDWKEETKSTLKRGTGRTLRSHTVAAQKEKKDKEKVDCAPIKKRKFKSRSDSSTSDKTLICSFNNNNQAPSSSSLFIKSSIKFDSTQDNSDSNTPTNVTDEKILMSQSKAEYWDNPYRKACKLHRQLNSLLFNLEVVHPKAPVGYQDFLLTTKKYLLANQNPQVTNIKRRVLPSDLKRSELMTLFKMHEEVRYTQALKHQTEREHLRLLAEQEVIRAQNKAARQLSGQDRPFSFCSAIALKDYTYIPASVSKLLEQNKNMNSESEKAEQLLYENFINLLKSLKDKFEKEKKRILTRQLHESESLKMVQQMDWELKLKEMLLEDIHGDPSLKRMSLEHVPMTDVPNDFALFTTDPFQIGSGCVPN